ncbi:MAG TPA: flagellar basal body rod protein FlgC [Sedimentisphaerales bacterium]|nr:flagellar basal body rod protein FlgC [Sedimentisphaerales bacterium]
MEINNMFGPIDIATSGMQAQDKQMAVISSNIANARTTDAGNGQPYRRLQAIFNTEADEISGVSVTEIIKDMGQLQKIFDPGNPKADKNGYVEMPNVELPVEMLNLAVAARTYEANVAVLKRYQQMVDTTLELLR